MLFTTIQKNNYQDSINLMLLTNSVNELEGVNKAQVMMATEANKDIMRSGGLFTDEVEAASPNDMAIVVDADDESVMDLVLEEVDRFLSDLSASKAADAKTEVDNWQDALDIQSNANTMLISIPGIYAADEIERALNADLHVMSFSDNVKMEDEVRLKKLAHEKGLLFMGPDCGTTIVSGVPLAFANSVRTGNISVVGASGTGIQETTTIIDRIGGGVVHAIGVGGHDLAEENGAVTMIDTLYALEKHGPTDVILVISKPPAKVVRDKVVQVLQSMSKPVVAIFSGEKPTEHCGNVYLAYTLEEAAQMAVDLAEGNEIKANYTEPLANDIDSTLADGKRIVGLYSGGTLASEAGTLIADALNLDKVTGSEGFILDTDVAQVMDLGDDVYTQGRPHPMISPEVRLAKLDEAIADDNTGVILFDCVLGYGSHGDMASQLAKPLAKALADAKEAGRELYAVATVVGTDSDPQDYNASVQTLKDAGVLVENSNAKAVRLALSLVKHEVDFFDKAHVPYTGEKIELEEPSEKVAQFLAQTPDVINIGLQGFVDPIENYGGKALQFNWRPRAGGDPKLIRILNAIEKMEDIQAANQEVTKRLGDSQPFLVDVKPAKELIPELDTDEKIVLHAGPPLPFEKMTGPAVGAIIGAMKFEKWATDDEDAMRQLEAGEVKFIPCHHVGAVGPMGGITTKNFPMLLVVNRADGTTGACIMNEGIGKVLRFGANGPDVIARLEWQRDVLGPVLSKALRSTEEGLNVNVMVAQAITMGDEFHQRNIAASLVFLKEVAPLITKLDDVDQKDKEDVIQFLADTDQFFLNIMMATGKAMVDYARKIEKGTIVTTMSRNGYEFGVRIAGMGDEWFKAPVNTPIGLYFTGYSAEDGNPDIGDSAITETIGVGGIAMVASPGVTRFVGSGGFNDALKTTTEMDRLYISNNSKWTIPTYDFKGAPLGLDACKVVELGIEPIINTGIAHKEAGKGQVGAGTVRAPLEAFKKALFAYADKLGIDYE
ncbi:MAG: acyl-CoA synthetase FdrA [Saccharofermentanales bacterium]|jgi:succinyl-CoA synthetase alpha subunit